jgi:hypothetical protein
MFTRIRSHVRSHVVGYLALFVALGGTALAADGPLAGRNTVGSADIINKEVHRHDLGFDARVAGKARQGTTAGTCDPNSTTFVVCDVVTFNLRAPARVFAVARARVAGSSGASTCQIGTTSGPISGSAQTISGEGDIEDFDLVGVTSVFPAGTHSVGLDCNETSGAMTFAGARIAIVTVSPD